MPRGSVDEDLAHARQRRWPAGRRPRHSPPLAPAGHAQSFFGEMALEHRRGVAPPTGSRNTRPAAKRSASECRLPPPARAATSPADVISTPQPSPLMPSALTPPRCESLASAANAVSTTQALARPSICATSQSRSCRVRKPGRTTWCNWLRHRASGLWNAGSARSLRATKRRWQARGWNCPTKRTFCAPRQSIWTAICLHGDNEKSIARGLSSDRANKHATLRHTAPPR
jgi:hypothetical protein